MLCLCKDVSVNNNGSTINPILKYSKETRKHYVCLAEGATGGVL